MKKRVTRIAVIALIAILLVIGIYCLLRCGFSVDVLDRSGWSTKGGLVRYLDYYGRPLLHWQKIDGKQYYFLPEDGNMITGWKQIGNGRYYFDENGIMATGWQNQGNKTFYIEPSGKQVFGWNRIEERLYYFTEDGSMAIGWHTLDGKQYYFGDTGVALTGWAVLDGKRYYFTENGTPLTGWQSIEGKQYYFTKDGYTLTGWVQLDNFRHLFAQDGAAVTGWFTDDTGKYFLKEDGQPHVGWLEREGQKYYFDQKGVMVTGWLRIELDRYYLRQDGTMAVGEVKIDGVSNFFTSKGKYVLVCNPWNAVPENYEPDLVNIEGYKIDSSCRDQLEAMMLACRRAGYVCNINNTYRSKAMQQWMWDDSVNRFMAAGMTYEEAFAETAKDTAYPGHSEHQTGLTVDILGTQGMYNWFAENCWDYGFILRYPKECTEETGIIYEPWHFRYVGTELSLELKSLGLCLEGYMAMLTPKETT